MGERGAELLPQQKARMWMLLAPAKEDDDLEFTAEEVFERTFPLLSRGGLLQQKYFAPLSNPRDFDASNVHIMTAPRPSPRGAAVTNREALLEMDLRCVHMLPASRPGIDRHSGRWNNRYMDLANRLEGLLGEWKRVRPGGPGRIDEERRAGLAGGGSSVKFSFGGMRWDKDLQNK